MLNPYKKRRRIRLPKTLNKIYSRSYISEAQNPNRKFKKHSRSYSKKRQIGFKELCIGNAKFRENLHKIQKSINEKYAKVRSLRDKKKRLEDIKKGIEKPVTMKKNSKKFKQKKLNLIQENEFLRAKLFKLKQEKMKRKRYRLSSSNENIRYYEILKEKYGVRNIFF